METIAERIGTAYEDLNRYMASRGIEPTGPSLIRYRRANFTEPFIIEAGWVVDESVWIEAPFVADVLPPGLYVVGDHFGPYSALAETTRATMQWGDEKAVTYAFEKRSDGDRWDCWYELYVTDPEYGPDGPSGHVQVCLLTKG